MAWGILEDRHMAMPPGTARLDTKFDPHQLIVTSQTNLKTDGDIILIPQPSDDPNDPLNWSPLWKNSVMGILGLLVAVAISQGSMITPGLPILAHQYHTSINTISTSLLGGHQFAAGAGMFIVSAAASIYGKRAFFVLGMVALVLTSVWGWLAGNFKSLTAARILSGLSASPVEALVTPVVADVFFVHQRGSRLAIWHTMIASGVGLGHVISGFIIQYRGIPATFWVSALCFGVLTPFVFFFVLETAYWRSKDSWSSEGLVVDEDITAPEKEVKMQQEEELKEETQIMPDEVQDPGGNLAEDKQLERPGSSVSSARTSGTIKRSPIPLIAMNEFSKEPATSLTIEPYVQRLKLFHGTFSKDPFLKLLVKPLPLLMFPAVLYSTIVNGFHIASLIGMGLLSINIFKDKPYSLDAAQLGMTSIPSLVVALIFSPLSGLLCDWIARYLSRKNSGIFEPEFRLLLMIVAVPISTAAFIGFGIVAERKSPLPYLLFFATLQGVAVPFASQAALTYVLDCYPRESNQAFVAIHFAKTLFAFAVTSSVSAWLEASGPRAVFFTLAGVNLLISSLTLPTYVFGKRFRSYISRSKYAQSIEAT